MADRKLNSIKFPNIDDRYILDSGHVEYDEAGTYNDGSVGKALQNKANTDGSYESMTVGNAEQLVSNVRVNDQTPYLFRTSGGSVDIGDREYINGIVGGTVAWNQLVRLASAGTQTYADMTIKTNSDGSIELNGTASESFWLSSYVGLTVPIATARRGHTVLMCFNGNATIPDTRQIGTAGAGYASHNNCAITNSFWSSDGNPIQLRIFEGDSYTNAKFYPQYFDLTQMFGSTIADYIYALETANAGAGVAWFKKLFPKPYYAYNAGELKSVSGLQSHDMTGFNQWDEEWEDGKIDTSTGAPVADVNSIRTKNYIPILPNTQYYYKAPSAIIYARFYFYDADKNFVLYDAKSTWVNGVFTTPTNAYYMKFILVKAYYGTTYNHDICINLAWDNSRNGEYEPYVKHSYPLDSDLTLRGIPKLDANNNLYYDGDIYEADGTVTRKYGQVIVDGSEPWTKSSSYNGNYYFAIGEITMRDAYPKNGTLNIVTNNGLKPVDSVAALSSNDLCVLIDGGNYPNINIKNVSKTTLEEFKTWLASNPITLVYELENPTTETAEPYQNPQIVDDFGTEEYILDDSAFPVPVGHDTDYPVNLVAKLEMAPNSPSGDGDYIVRQVNGENSYVPLVIEDALPTIPSTAGSYKLTVTVADGSDPVISWTQA